MTPERLPATTQEAPNVRSPPPASPLGHVLAGSERGRDDVARVAEIARLSATGDDRSMRSSACASDFGITPPKGEIGCGTSLSVLGSSCARPYRDADETERGRGAAARP